MAFSWNPHFEITNVCEKKTQSYAEQHQENDNVLERFFSSIYKQKETEMIHMIKGNICS